MKRCPGNHPNHRSDQGHHILFKVRDNYTCRQVSAVAQLARASGSVIGVWGGRRGEEEEEEEEDRTREGKRKVVGGARLVSSSPPPFFSHLLVI